MRIEHIAIWTKDIEKLKCFYVYYFNATANSKYTNSTKQFESYFLSFDSGCRIEIMQMPDVVVKEESSMKVTGLAHFAVSVGSKEKVISLTDRIRQEEYNVLSEPRTTGDGYFESVVCDPDGNSVEITI